MHSHSRSFILHSITGRQGAAYRHYNIAGLIPEVSEEVATQIAKKLPSSSTPLPFDAPPAIDEVQRISTCTFYFQKLEWLTYIFVADSMGLSSFFCLMIFDFARQYGHFYRAMHFSAKRGYEIAYCLSVCPSARLSVCP